MKKIFVSKIKAGDLIEDVFVMSDKTLSQKRDGNNFLNITLSDKSGNIKGVIWDNVDQISSNVKSGDFVHVKASAGEYRQALQLVIKKMQVYPSELVDPADFLPVTSRDVETMFQRLVKITDSMSSVHLQKLFASFWNDHEFVKKFKTAPAAKKMHHAYIGGLLEHTLSMVTLGEKISGHYNGVDKDMLVSGTILHDIGKVREFTYEYAIDYSDEGRLLNHIVIGIEMLNEKLLTVKDFPEETAYLLKHMIVSHHGSREFGSPEPPKTIEAVILYYIDEIDSKVNGIRNFMDKEDPDETWTSYHRLLGRHFYNKP